VVAALALAVVTSVAAAALGTGVDLRSDESDALLGVNATRVFERVERLTDEDGPDPRLVADRAAELDATDASFDPLFAAFADGNRTRVRRVAAHASGDRVRLVVTDAATPADVEGALAHEHAHVLQPDGLADRLDARLGEYADTTDGTLAAYGVVEGAATYVESRYVERHLSGVEPPDARFLGAWAEWPAANRLLWGPYVFGARYVAERVPSPARLSIVYRDPPRTTEQLLHGLEPGAEPRRSLSVTADAADSPWSAGKRDAKGELYLRVVLGTGLPPERAAAAAAGWGADRTLSVHASDRSGHAWVVRFDDAANATEFADAVPGVLADARRSNDAAYRAVRVTPETVAILVGDPAFVAGSEVAGGNGSVTVTPPDSVRHARDANYSQGTGWRSVSDAAV
jgi:hypothetical protein